MLDLDEVIGEAHRAEGQRHQQRKPDETIAQVRPQQGGDADRRQNHHPAHGRGAGLGLMRRRTQFAHHLAELEVVQLANHERAADEGKNQRRQHPQNGAKGQVIEQVERTDVRFQRLREVIQHQQSPPVGGFINKATTPSMAAAREPLTSKVVVGPSSDRKRRTSAVCESNTSAAAPNPRR